MFSSNTSQVSSAANYIEDVFSTWLYTGTGSSQTITNNIDTTTYGGLVWIKGRSGATGHRFTDTARGTTKSLESNSTAAEATESTGLTAFGTSGFTIGTDADYNTNAATYASWTFRKQAKFFDVVTYTGNDVNGRQISHNLGSTPGCIIIKCLTGSYASSSNWTVYHRSLANSEGLFLNTTAAASNTNNFYPHANQTATYFTVTNERRVNNSQNTYVAYLFAHDAGGFGLAGTDNVISCGSFTTDASSNATISLGYEPQWVLLKANSAGQPWILVDQMRKLTVNSSSNVAELYPNTSDAEVTAGGISPNATGFTANAQLSPSTTYIYIAIRRGPMKTPTSGTSVYNAVTYTGNNTNPRLLDFSLNLDAALFHKRNSNVDAANIFGSRLVGDPVLYTDTTASEVSLILANNAWASNVGVSVRDDGKINGTSSYTYVSWGFKRAPGFMDVVCYTGTSIARTVTHNLGVVPELIIVKNRNTAFYDWYTYCAYLNGGVTPQNWWVKINASTQQFNTGAPWNNTAPTSSVFSLGTNAQVNASPAQNGGPYVAYLFASCPGVSKVGGYTGTGTTKQIDCGFTGGARFVLIKRTDSTGDWYVWDSARGIVSGNDPYLLLNSTAAEVTNTDYIDTYSAGFEISSTAPAAINANGGTFIFLAIA